LSQRSGLRLCGDATWEGIADTVTDHSVHRAPAWGLFYGSSGQVKPSSENRRIIEQLKKAGKILGISFLDHAIVCRNKYLSIIAEKSL